MSNPPLLTREQTAFTLRLLLTLLTSIAAGAYLFRAFGDPTAFAIPDDARQFLSWTARIADPAALPGDIIADYWFSVSPGLYRLLFELGGWFGLRPMDTARFLPLALLFLTSTLAWSAASRISRDPLAIFAMAVSVMILVVQDDSIFSGTPRAFMAPFFLLFLDGLLADRRIRAIAGLALLAAIYPAPAVAGLALLGLSRLRPGRAIPIDFSRGSILYVAAATLAVAAVILPFRGETAKWGPTLTLSEARGEANLMSPDGRSRIVDKGGDIAWLCSPRIGFLPMAVRCNGNTDPRLIANILILIAPALFLFAGAWRKAKANEQAGKPPPPELLYGYAIIAAIICYAIAMMLAFKLHLPSRYSQRMLSITGALAFGQLLILLGRQWLSGKRHAAWLAPALGGVAALACIALFALPRANLKQPSEPALIASVQALPESALIGGLSPDIDFLPAVTGHAILASAEHAIPYQRGYFTPLRQRLDDSIEAATTDNPAIVARYIAKYRLDTLLLDRRLSRTGEVPRAYRGLTRSAKADARPFLGTARAAECLVFQGSQTLMFDAPCLLRMATEPG